MPIYRNSIYSRSKRQATLDTKPERQETAMSDTYWSKDGLIIWIPEPLGIIVIQRMRQEHGFKFGNGNMGRGLYSPTWDRQMGEWDEQKLNGKWEKMLYVNPSVILHYLTEFTPKTDVRI